MQEKTHLNFVVDNSDLFHCFVTIYTSFCCCCSVGKCARASSSLSSSSSALLSSVDKRVMTTTIACYRQWQWNVTGKNQFDVDCLNTKFFFVLFRGGSHFIRFSIIFCFLLRHRTLTIVVCQSTYMNIIGVLSRTSLGWILISRAPDDRWVVLCYINCLSFGTAPIYDAPLSMPTSTQYHVMRTQHKK